MKVQNITGHALDVAGGPSLAPGESAEVTASPEVKAAIDIGLLAQLDEKKSSKKGNNA